MLAYLLLALVVSVTQGASFDPADTAVVFTDVQNDFLSPNGVTWEVVGASVTELNTVENIDSLFRAAKELGFLQFISPHYYYPHDHQWMFKGTLEALMHNIGMFDRVDPLSLEGFEGSGADYLEQYKQHIIGQSDVIVTSPHKVYGPEANDLVLQLRKRKIDRVILAGMSANLCVESHLRELLEQGFDVTVVSDATAAAETPELGDGYYAALTNFRFIANSLMNTTTTLGEMGADNEMIQSITAKSIETTTEARRQVKELKRRGEMMKRQEETEPEPLQFDSSNTALVLTDIQNDFLSPDGVTWGVVGESVTELNTVENIETLLMAAQDLGYLVFVSPHYYYPYDHEWMFKGTLEALMHDIGMFDRVDPLSLDGFEGSGADYLEQYKKFVGLDNFIVANPHKVYGPTVNDLVLQLRKRKIDRVILAGMSANLCVESHMRSLLEAGFDVTTVADATAAAKTPELGDGYAAAIINQRFMANAVVNTTEVVDAMSPSSAGALFPALSLIFAVMASWVFM